MISKEMATRWIAQAEVDPRLRTVLDEVQAKYELGIKIVDKTEWSSTVDGQKATIEVADTDRPMAAFAHELLHLRLSARGYRHILGNGNRDEAKRILVSYVLSALDNELQHHRMFPEFIAHGFDEAEFYADSDDTAIEAVLGEIEILSSSGPVSLAFLPYLSLIAPGGGWLAGARESALEQLKSKASSEVWQKLLATKAVIDAWAGSCSLDPTDTIVTILELLGDVDGTWIAEDVTNYPVGSFIPRSMTQEQFEGLASMQKAPLHEDGGPKSSS